MNVRYFHIDILDLQASRQGLGSQHITSAIVAWHPRARYFSV
jgi:hypothetical protein